jgi:hypothetical protein
MKGEGPFDMNVKKTRITVHFTDCHPLHKNNSHNILDSLQAIIWGGENGEEHLQGYSKMAIIDLHES